MKRLVTRVLFFVAILTLATPGTVLFAQETTVPENLKRKRRPRKRRSRR